MTYYATSEEIEMLDNLAIAYGLEIKQMMELAGWHILSIFNELKIPKDVKIVVICGKGNKGGDGLSAARHLFNHGYRVEVVLASKQLAPNPKHHLNLIKKINIPTTYYSDKKSEAKKVLESSDIIIDALIGYHLKGSPRGEFGEIVRMVNASGKRVIAYDLPTGIDATTGECFDPCIKASATLTLALPKKAFEFKKAKNKSGEIFLADIGIPSIVYNKVCEDCRPDFEVGKNSIIKL